MKVGDYVRTPQGIIAKIINIQEDIGQYFFNGNAVSLESKNYIADKNITIGENFKHSPNIIDLIERFDLVNGHLVICKMYENEKDIPTIVKCVGDYYFKEKDIKSIVTKESMESVTYYVK